MGGVAYYRKDGRVPVFRSAAVMDGSKRVAMAWVLGAAGALGRGAMPVIGVASVLALAGQAHADVKSVPVKYVVVTKDNAAMRCADGGHFYAVRMLSAGETLRVDGEGSGWLRVAYPAGTKAYVGQAEGTFDATAKTMKLTRGSKMMAANEGGAAPWWPLLEKDVAAGTVFSDAEPVKAADGTVQGYLVTAPAQARGFVRAEMTRPASADEAAKAGGPVAVKPIEGAKPADPAKTADATRPIEAAKPADGTTPAQEIVEVKPADGTGGTTTTTVTMTNSRTTTAPAKPNPELTKRVDDISLLRDLFDRAMQRSESEAEVQTVISEFNRKIDALPMSGEDGRVRVALEQRRDALTLRQEILETRRKINAPDMLDERMKQIRVAIEQANRQAVYTVVGRILPSTVYDGKRGMPMMYRIESADLSSTRTIGYVVPRDGVDLLPKMGKMVGIIGESKLDPALQLNIIAPTRVDELQVVGGKLEVVPGTSSGVPAAPTPTPAPAPAPGSAATPAPGTPASQPLATPGTSDTGEPNK
jgi:hypothetical protein